MKQEHFEITYRHAKDGDLSFLYKLYRETRLGEVSAFGWDDESAEGFLRIQFDHRRQAYRMQYPSAVEKIFLAGGETVGSLLVDATDISIVVVDIAVAVTWRRRGVASRVIRDLQAETNSCRRKLILRVDKANDGALALYKKMGFEIEGENQIMYSMVWQSIEV